MNSRRRNFFGLAILTANIFLSSYIIEASTILPLNAPPPITKVVLYKHGLGYIEREISIKDNQALSLYFPEREMNDILASFYAIDLNGGKITSIQYETQEPISERLKKILIKIPDKSTLSGLIAELKGAEISAKVADETVEGRILGLEPVEEITSNQIVKRDFRMVIKSDTGAIRTLSLSSLIELKLKNEALNKDITELLDISLEGKYSNFKKMTISTQGTGERIIRIGYLINMPVWKCSYRLLFDSKEKEKALVQGWALAENATDDDWNEIDIAFVTGNPISFSMNLYSPLYISRQSVPVPGMQSLNIDWENAPREQTAVNKAKNKELLLARESKSIVQDNYAYLESGAGDNNMAFSAPAALSAQEGEYLSDYLANSVEQSVRGKTLGTLFSYNVEDKISIQQKRAAMIPILTSSMSCRKLLYYKKSFSLNVLNAAVLHNDSELTLDAGPVAFFEGNASLGEGILNQTLTPGNQEIIPYAIASYASIISTSNYDKSAYFKGKLVNGVLTLTRTEMLTSIMEIESKGKNSETLWIEFPASSLYTLVEPEKPLKESDGHYLFEIALNPGEKKEFTIKEKRNIEETVVVTDCDDKTVSYYASAPYLDKKVRDFLKEISELKSRAAELKINIENFTKQIKALSEKEKRIRQNIELLRGAGNAKEQTLRSNWIGDLASSETEIENLNTKINHSFKELEKLNNEIKQKINNFGN
ncbi:MAG TPA: DUF4139 domain-containing protein [Lentisphaeria bacterium]|nr:MAG: hypothetical protein A2X47_09465 [Lentisphaerae bacterium GWF2_38_69]HBM17101.1 DUF4139 domain-containing protein [Lentisphaeria bacterium]